MTESERQELRDKHGKDEGNEPSCTQCDLTKYTYLESIVNNNEILCGWTVSGIHNEFSEWFWFCKNCEDTQYPCDVIKVLDSWEGK